MSRSAILSSFGKSEGIGGEAYQLLLLKKRIVLRVSQSASSAEFELKSVLVRKVIGEKSYRALARYPQLAQVLQSVDAECVVLCSVERFLSQ